jgi:hypothetical protein
MALKAPVLLLVVSASPRIGAVKTATCAGVIFRARLIAVTGGVVIHSSNCSRHFQEGSPAFE